MPKKGASKGYCIFAFGAKKIKGISRRSIEAALMKIVNETKAELHYVVLGNVRETDKVLYSICRKRHLPIAVAPADFEKFSINAEHFRNGLALKFFKPSELLIMHPSPEEESSVKVLMTWARNHNAKVTLVPTKKVGKKK